MAGGRNLAVTYAKQVNERFYKESQAAMALNNDYKFTGSKTVNVFSIPTVPMVDYARNGLNRYGVPSDLSRNVQSMTVNQDKAFSFIIDKGDKIQSQMVSDAGKALSRQIREVCIPLYDTHVFRTLAAKATERGNFSNKAITKTNAYEAFLEAEERLGDHNVPDKGRVAFCSYKFANLLKQDSSFMKYSNLSQEMVIKGVLGECDGVKVVKVPSSRLPAGCAFIMTHPDAATGPKQLEDYKVHDNPPGVSGWLCEGRFIFDCFVLNEKADAVYYHGSQPVLKVLNVTTAATDANKSTIIIEPGVLEGAKRYYKTAADVTGLIAVEYGTAITASSWTELTSNGMEITPASGHTVVRVVEVDSANKPIAVGTTALNIG